MKSNISFMFKKLKNKKSNQIIFLFKIIYNWGGTRQSHTRTRPKPILGF